MVASHGKSLKSFDQGQKPSLLLDFARRKSLVDQVSKSNLITFTRATAATYIGADGLIKTAAVNEARFDHDPTTRRSLGLLIEEQRTNLLRYSEQFDNALWTKNNTTVTANSVAAPSGALTADKVTESAATGQFFASQSMSGTAGLNYTLSVFLKKGPDATSPDIVQMTLPSAIFGGAQHANFNISSGEIVTEVGCVASISKYGNGWYRCSLSAVATATGSSLLAAFLMTNNNASLGRAPIYTGSTTSSVYAWGAQIEEGAFPTSYIPTTTAAATRNVDSVLIDGANFSSWYNQNEGSFFAEYQRPFDAKAVGYSNPNIFHVSVGASGGWLNMMYSFTNGSNDSEYTYVRKDFIDSAKIEHPPAIGANESAKRSMSYSATLSMVSSCRDGGTPIDDTSAPVHTSMSTMRIGNTYFVPSSGSDVHNGTIKRIIYWPTKLDNSDLQEATR